ncbi:hypothetical protein FC093_04120 [Ilyomonas limi]|uniref:Uncharacterized protein n=1 Tax=Ilyomonas limi TaxID=2575867 RepID=A0A4U3L6M4_9BACT|nr:hypothetical protein [Ilyomonas limi]TKK70888.1 hypothetical protein FC093_04120 [Ilyomonas limi]
METSLIPRYTYADYAQWKEDWELIKGYPYQLLPSARWQHNSVQVRLSKQAMDSFIKIATATAWYLQDWIGK